MFKQPNPCGFLQQILQQYVAEISFENGEVLTIVSLPYNIECCVSCYLRVIISQFKHKALSFCIHFYSLPGTDYYNIAVQSHC